MVDLEVLKRRGITPESLRTSLSGNPLTWTAEKDGPKKALWNRIRSRLQEGMNRNFQDYRIYKALDVAWDTPFRQVTPTALENFLESNPDETEVQKQMDAWGLSHMITQEVDKRTGKPTGKQNFNLPVLREVLVPLVRAYVTIRWAKIMNDRRLTPFFKFEPAKVTAANRLRCEAITDRVEVMSNQYGYYDTTKQAVLKMLHYSWCLQFPKEEWHSEEHIRIAGPEDVLLGAKKFESEEKAVEGDEILATDREGLRYHLPHPTRFYRDLNHPAYTYNYDCGAEFAGYWSIRRYRDLANGDYWNTDSVSIGPNSLIEDHRSFFASVYSGCTLQIPVLPKATSNDGTAFLAQTGSGVGDLDREKSLAYLYYGTDHMDQGVLTTEHFEKVNPKRDGLGNYDGNVWFRFVVAGDNSTFLYAAPLPYAPVVYYGYDADESRTNNASLSMEVLPFQDQFSNVLTQILLTAKQNLANLTLVDQDVLTPDSISKIENLGEKLFRRINVFSFSGKKMARQQSRTAEAIQSHNLPKGNTAELITVLKTILDVLERVLVMSSHEVAQAASHEQTREEVRNIAVSTSTRLLFTATPVDIAREAWKRQLYCGLMAYGDESFFAHVPSNIPLTSEALSAMGFTMADPKEHRSGKDNHVRVRLNKRSTAIDLWTLASTRDGDDRTNDAQTAQAMAQIGQQLLANPITAQAIGADQFIAIANQICQLAGLPRDFVLRDMSQQSDPAAAQQQAQQQLQQVVNIVLSQVNKGLQGELKPLMDQTVQNSKDVALILKALNVAAPHPNDSLNQEPTPGPQG